MPKKLFLVDGSNQAFRAFFAMKGDFRSPDGFPTGALFGFANIIRKMLREDQPDYMAVLFDRGPSFRSDIYPDYKGHRPDMPEDLRQQWPEFEPLSKRNRKDAELCVPCSGDSAGTVPDPGELRSFVAHGARDHRWGCVSYGGDRCSGWLEEQGAD